MEKNEQRAAPQAPGAPGAGTGTPPEAVPRSAEDGRSGISGMATTIAGAAGPVLSAALRPVGELTSGARRAIGERSGARVRRVRQRGRQPLLNMWEVHPEAHRAALRELGMLTVPADEIAGTAVEGPTQRGGDFLPLRQLRGADWRARWARILEGIDRMAALPPVDLLKFGDRYWVVDGHNRVAAGLYTGQVELDADVIELRLPGMAPSSPPQTIAPVLEGSAQLRAAGSGRHSRTATQPESLRPTGPPPEPESGGE